MREVIGGYNHRRPFEKDDLFAEIKQREGTRMSSSEGKAFHANPWEGVKNLVF